MNQSSPIGTVWLVLLGASFNIAATNVMSEELGVPGGGTFAPLAASHATAVTSGCVG